MCTQIMHGTLSTRDLLLNRTDDKLADMTMVADLSHWVNVAETDCNDPDLGWLMELRGWHSYSYTAISFV